MQPSLSSIAKGSCEPDSSVVSNERQGLGGFLRDNHNSIEKDKEY